MCLGLITHIIARWLVLLEYSTPNIMTIVALGCLEIQNFKLHKKNLICYPWD